MLFIVAGFSKTFSRKKKRTRLNQLSQIFASYAFVGIANEMS